jgi:holo-[acyl-carrier protein] synthase
MTMVGVDVQAVDEVEMSLQRFGTRYTRRLFTNREVKDCSEKPIAAARRYAERFAAKEAVLKVLNVREHIPSWKDIEIHRTTDGRFGVVLFGSAAEVAHQRGIREISVDIIHAGGVAIAVAVVP